jgi:regulator of protease activity HflC (stomatin/prohibitin superfamily)
MKYLLLAMLIVLVVAILAMLIVVEVNGGSATFHFGRLHIHIESNWRR